MKRKCSYKNCNALIQTDSKKLYCCRECKQYALTYRKREEKALEKEKQRIVEMLLQYDPNGLEIIKLFNQIYK